MVELRKRKAPAQPPVSEKKSKVALKSRRIASKKESSKEVVDPSHSGSSSDRAPLAAGNTINLEEFGGEVETNDGTKTTLKKLVDASKSGVVLFTYPRASTPGCTRQACLFRDNHDHLVSAGLSVYGLSADSPKANTTFKTKQRLQYPLLCDTSATLITALGFKKVPKGTVRGVFVINKEGKVLLLQAGGPEATVEAVQQLVATNFKDEVEGKPDGSAGAEKK